LLVDTVNQPGATTLQLDNTIIKNMAGVALAGEGSSIKANNCVFANCGQYLAELVIGGNYRFLHCTFADFWSNGNRQTPSLLINNYYTYNGSTILRRIDSAYFGNCILYGTLDNELGLDSTYTGSTGDFNYFFDHCLLKVDYTIPTNSGMHFNTVITGYDPLFKDIANNIYEIDSTSIAVDAGIISITNLAPVLQNDLNNNPRPHIAGGLPDLGAYEKR